MKGPVDFITTVVTGVCIPVLLVVLITLIIIIAIVKLKKKQGYTSYHNILIFAIIQHHNNT